MQEVRANVMSMETALHSSGLPFVSVIIPVLNDAKRLQLCLEALAQQTYPRANFEVIVVDNGSEPEQAVVPVVRMFEQTLERVVAVHESYPSSFAARNCGVALAHGEVIAFTDADCIPAADWLEQGVAALTQTPNCGLVAGRIDVFFRDPKRATPVELYESVTAFPQQQLVERQQFGATANVFTYKAVLNRVGGFEPSLKGTGDVEWGQRVAAAGYRQVYSDHARVAHPARYSWAELHKRSIRLVGGLYDLSNYRIRSAWRRQLQYGITLMENLVPPVNFIINAFRNPQLRGLKQKLQVSLAMVFVRYVSAGELIRLKLGGISTRD